MKIAVLSDIHSNHIALEACIKHAEKMNIDRFLFLGDYVSGCPYPQKAMEIIYDIRKKYESYFIRGNGDEYMLHHQDNPNDGWKFNSASGNLLYTYENLSETELTFWRNLDIKSKFNQVGYKPFQYCHGSLKSSKEKLMQETDISKKALKELETDMLVCGHTHQQGTFEYSGKKLINPGSVGLPIGYGGKAQFAILHGKSTGWEEEYLQVTYNINQVLNEFEESCLNQKAQVWARICKTIIITGRDTGSDCLHLATKLCQMREGAAKWPDIPEEYWEQAAAILNIL